MSEINTTHICYLSLGSNLGDRAKNLGKAISSLAPQVQPLIQSSIYQTEPWGYSDQPNFLNQSVKAETTQDPFDLLEYLKTLEKQLGRQETFRFGPRLIDIDILLYDDLVLDTPELTIPHPRIQERAFVLIPLAEIAPDLILPKSGKSIQQLKSTIEPNSVELFQSVKPSPGA
jgi:2-amino-4-hydroxy-6-hydroxymethyldihydropteridine diphosphokinase